MTNQWVILYYEDSAECEDEMLSQVVNAFTSSEAERVFLKMNPDVKASDVADIFPQY